MSIEIVSLQVVKDRSVEYGNEQISNSKELSMIGKKFIGDSDREIFLMACLDTKNKINALHVVSVGCLTSTTIHPREVFKLAILCNAAAIAFVHNHPSGDPTPSQEDVEITYRLMACAKLFGIFVHDHVIIGDGESYLSLRDNGIMKGGRDGLHP